ncbi:hypothetical protein KKC1_19120 [Calderihabitans maritimus]|uniref:Uncharacterized protein n=2 Tax=Calderihabitans maritimus TaxID=1246530 RepID=A0A1Z5HTA6_9FIRM|nr:hypothetical protein KKC1_19120 [Calderihabitans maritimus]
MVRIFSWLIAICLGFYFIGTIVFAMLEPGFILPFLSILLVICLMSSIGLIIALILERIKDRKEEKDAFNKY